MNCENCKTLHAVPDSILYHAHEFAMARAERTIRRMWITTLILIFLLVGTNVAWLYYENQFQDVVTTYEAVSEDGGTAIANGDGEVNYNG